MSDDKSVTQDERDDAQRAPLAEEAADPNEQTRRGSRRLLVGAALIGLFLVSLAGGAYALSGWRSKVTVGGGRMQADSRSDQVQTDAVIRDLSAQFAAPTAGSGSPPDAQPVVAAADPTAGVAASVAGTSGAAPPQPESAPEPEPPPPAPRENPQKSYYYAGTSATPAPSARAVAYASAATGGARTLPVSTTSRAASPAAPVLPPFGATIPVRTLGATYTLASGGLVRLEVTRDVSGPGWSLRRGSVFVGTIRGGEASRAFVSAVGWIDPASNRLVQVKGDCLGADGGSGLEGKRKKVGSGWTRALAGFGRTVASVGTGAAQVAVNGAVTRAVRGAGQSIVLRDTLGPVLPIGSEFNAIGTDKSYVEVKAGTLGYILITDLPDTIKGVDAAADWEAQDIAEFADAGRARPTTGLSEDELSHLVSEGSPDEIREAMPRMSPELRVVAERVLASGVR